MGMFTGRNSREVMGYVFLDGKRLGDAYSWGKTRNPRFPEQCYVPGFLPLDPSGQIYVTRLRPQQREH